MFVAKKKHPKLRNLGRVYSLLLCASHLDTMEPCGVGGSPSVVIFDSLRRNCREIRCKCEGGCGGGAATGWWRRRAGRAGCASPPPHPNKSKVTFSTRMDGGDWNAGLSTHTCRKHTPYKWVLIFVELPLNNCIVSLGVCSPGSVYYLFINTSSCPVYSLDVGIANLITVSSDIYRYRRRYLPISSLCASIILLFFSVSFFAQFIGEINDGSSICNSNWNAGTGRGGARKWWSAFLSAARILL